MERFSRRDFLILTGSLTAGLPGFAIVRSAKEQRDSIAKAQNVFPQTPIERIVSNLESPKILTGIFLEILGLTGCVYLAVRKFRFIR